jgi:hypothetical protein
MKQVPNCTYCQELDEGRLASTIRTYDANSTDKASGEYWLNEENSITLTYLDSESAQLTLNKLGVLLPG